MDIGLEGAEETQRKGLECAEETQRKLSVAGSVPKTARVSPCEVEEKLRYS
jgi:hypothetical protein